MIQAQKSPNKRAEIGCPYSGGGKQWHITQRGLAVAQTPKSTTADMHADDAVSRPVGRAAPLPSGKRRRWYQFTLGKLLFLLLVIGLLLVKPARILHQTGRELALREAVVSAGGKVKLRPITGDWLRWALGAENSSVVFEVTFSEVEPPADLLARLDGFPAMTNLFIGNAPLRDSDLMMLPDLPELQNLGVARTLVNGSFLQRAKDFPKLRALSLSSSPVTDEHMRNVAALANIETIYLVRTQITGVGLRRLYNLQNLRRVDLDESIAPADQQALQQALPGAKVEVNGGSRQRPTIRKAPVPATLEDLRPALHVQVGPDGQRMMEFYDDRLDHERIGDGHLKLLVELAPLHYIDLQHSQITGEGLKYLLPLDTLRHLALNEVRDIDRGAKYLAQLPALKTLVLALCPLGNSGLAALCDSQSIEELHVGSRRISDEGVKHLARLKTLRTLRLGQANLSDGGLAYLADVSGLEVLDIVGDGCFSDDGVRKLVQLKSLRELNISGIFLTDASLEALASLPELRKLTLGKTRITDEGLVHVRAMPQLERLLIYDNPQISPRAIEQLRHEKSALRINVN